MSDVNNLGRRNSGVGVGGGGGGGGGGGKPTGKTDVEKIHPGAVRLPQAGHVSSHVNVGASDKLAAAEKIEPKVGTPASTSPSSSSSSSSSSASSSSSSASSSSSSSSSSSTPVHSTQSAAVASSDTELVKALFETHTGKSEFLNAAGDLSLKFSAKKHPWAARVAAVQNKGVAAFEDFVNVDHLDKVPKETRAVISEVLQRAAAAFDEAFPPRSGMTNPALKYKPGFLVQVLGRLLGRAAVPMATTDAQRAFLRLMEALPQSRQSQVSTMAQYFK